MFYLITPLTYFDFVLILFSFLSGLFSTNFSSGVFGLMKLTLPKALPVSIDKVIVLDTDVTFSTDIAELWKIFRVLRGKQAIGKGRLSVFIVLQMILVC